MVFPYLVLYFHRSLGFPLEMATTIAACWGLGSFLAQVFLRGPLIQAATQEFSINGTWADPRVERIQGRRGTAAGDTAMDRARKQPKNYARRRARAGRRFRGQSHAQAPE